MWAKPKDGICAYWHATQTTATFNATHNYTGAEICGQRAECEAVTESAIALTVTTQLAQGCKPSAPRLYQSCIPVSTVSYTL